MFPLVYSSSWDKDTEWVQDVTVRFVSSTWWAAFENHDVISINWAIEEGKKLGCIKSGDSVVCVHGWVMMLQCEMAVIYILAQAGRPALAPPTLFASSWLSSAAACMLCDIEGVPTAVI